MKIICTTCGKKYDPLRKEGICPYCGMHASDTQLAEAQDNDKVQGGNVSEVLRSYLNERLRRQQKRSPLRSRKVQIPLCVLMLAVIAGIFVWGNFHYRSRADYFAARRDTTDIHREQHKAGDSIVLVGGSDPVSVSVRVLGCKVRDDLQDKVEGDFKIIELDYEDQGSPISVRLSNAYLQTAGGCTVRSLDKYDIMELTGMSEDEFYASDYSEGIFSTPHSVSSRHRVLLAAPMSEKEHTILMFRQTSSFDRDKSVEMRYEFKLKEDPKL